MHLMTEDEMDSHVYQEELADLFADEQSEAYQLVSKLFTNEHEQLVTKIYDFAVEQSIRYPQSKSHALEAALDHYEIPMPMPIIEHFLHMHDENLSYSLAHCLELLKTVFLDTHPFLAAVHAESSSDFSLIQDDDHDEVLSVHSSASDWSLVEGKTPRPLELSVQAAMPLADPSSSSFAHRRTYKEVLLTPAPLKTALPVARVRRAYTILKLGIPPPHFASLPEDEEPAFDIYEDELYFWINAKLAGARAYRSHVRHKSFEIGRIKRLAALSA